MEGGGEGVGCMVLELLLEVGVKWRESVLQLLEVGSYWRWVLNGGCWREEGGVGWRVLEVGVQGRESLEQL